MRYLLFIVLFGTIACTKENDVWRLPENPASSYVSDDTLWNVSFRSTYYNVDISNLPYYQQRVLVGNMNVQVGKIMWYSTPETQFTICRNWTGELQVTGTIHGKSFLLYQLPEGTYINVCGGQQNSPVTFGLSY